MTVGARTPGALGMPMPWSLPRALGTWDGHCWGRGLMFEFGAERKSSSLARHAPESSSGLTHTGGVTSISEDESTPSRVLISGRSESPKAAICMAVLACSTAAATDCAEATAA